MEDLVVQDDRYHGHSRDLVALFGILPSLCHRPWRGKIHTLLSGPLEL